MSLETLNNLNPTTIEALKELYATNVGSISFYEEAADTVDGPSVARVFRNVAKERGLLAAELRRRLKDSGVEVEREAGTWRDTLHETWTKLRGMVNGGDRTVLLIEAERAEDRIKGCYEALLKKAAGSPLNAVLLDEYRRVKSTHDLIRGLRDLAKAI